MEPLDKLVPVVDTGTRGIFFTMPRQFPATAVQRRGKPLTRGELAARTGCNIETIRYYERVDLLPPPPRSAGGHRL